MKKFQQKGRSSSQPPGLEPTLTHQPVASIPDDIQVTSNIDVDSNHAESSPVPDDVAETAADAPVEQLLVSSQTSISYTSTDHQPIEEATEIREPIETSPNILQSQLIALAGELDAVKTELQLKNNYIETLTCERNELANRAQNIEVIRDLEQQLADEKNLKRLLQNQLEETEKQLKRQLGSAAEELHSKSNTIKILIEEKNDLDVARSHFCDLVGKLEKALGEEQKKSEELGNELETYRQRVAHVEAVSQSTISSLSQQLAAVSDELNMKNIAFGAANEELEELKIRHAKQTSDLNQREVALKEHKSHIDLMEINLQQLKNAGVANSDQAAKNQMQENSSLEEEIGQLRQQLGKVAHEKDLLAQQYQQYIQRLNGQVRTLRTQVINRIVRLDMNL